MLSFKDMEKRWRTPTQKQLCFSINPAWQDKFITPKDEDIYNELFKKNNLNKKWWGSCIGTLDDGKTYEIVNPRKGWVDVELELDSLFSLITEQGAATTGCMVGGERVMANFVKINIALVDIDDTTTVSLDNIEQHEFYQKYCSGYYTTPSHKPDDHRFRLVFVLDRVITEETDIRAIYTALIHIFGADGSCKDGSRIFFGSKNAQHKIIPNKVIPNNIIDQLIEDGTEEEVAYVAPDNITFSDDDKEELLNLLKNTSVNEYDAWWKMLSAMITAGYNFNDLCYVSAGNPNHSSGSYKNKTAANMKHRWDSFNTPSSRSISPGYLWNLVGGKPKKPTASVEDLTTGFKKRSHKRKIDNEPIIDMDYEDAWTRKERWTKLKKSIWEYKTGTHLILAGEGYGKSHLAVKWGQDDRKILFTSLSNEQAEEQADSFRAAGLRVQLLTGTEYNLNKLGIEVERYPHINPWQIGNINEPATVVRIMIKYACDEEEAQDIFDMNKPRMPRFNDVDIVVTTHARLTGWGAMNNKIGDTDAPMVPRYVTIIIDDPSANQFKRLTPYDERFVNCKIDGNDIEQAEYDKYHYFIKPDKYTLGFGFPYHMKVFTTTELLISNLMETVYPDLILHNMLQKRVFSGNITMFKTKLVYSKFDAVIPLLVNRLERRTRSDIVYIANGQGMEHNLINTKGQNKFSEKHIIIEISEAPLNVIHQWCHELGWDINDEEYYAVNIVKYIIAQDEMQQAIGRNRGYRWKDRIDSGDDTGYAMVVLMAPSLVEQLVHASRYHFTEVKDLEPLTGTGKMPEAWSVAGGMEWLINNVGRYMDVGVSAKQRKDRPDIQSDIKAVFEKLKGRGKHIQFFQRLEKVSMYLMEYNLDRPLFNLIPQKLNEIGKKLENILRNLE